MFNSFFQLLIFYNCLSIEITDHLHPSTVKYKNNVHKSIRKITIFVLKIQQITHKVRKCRFGETQKNDTAPIIEDCLYVVELLCFY